MISGSQSYGWGDLGVLLTGSQVSRALLNLNVGFIKIQNIEKKLIVDVEQ